MKEWLRPIAPVFHVCRSAWIGILRDPSHWRSLFGEVRWYAVALRTYRRLAARSRPTEPVTVSPVLFQRTPSMPFDAHYLYQAAWATTRILGVGPSRHVDVSSNIPFIGQLSAVAPVLYLEYNPPRLRLPGVRLIRGSLTALPFADRSLKTLSCLHVIEHVGLGRYGDPLDPEGTRVACRELVRCLAPGGSLFLSVPVGRRRTCFNAHRILAPQDIVDYVSDLDLVEFSVVTDSGDYLERVALDPQAGMEYACGLYWFQRPIGAPAAEIAGD